MSLEGTVIKSTGSWYLVRTADHTVYRCRIKGKYRIQGLNLTNPLAVGDVVEFDAENEEEGIVTAIKPRSNYVVRQSPRKKHQLHLLASNIDQAAVVVTIREPGLKPGFIDRFLLMTETFNIPVIVIINKIDLLDADDMDLAMGVAGLYQSIGYEAALVSAESGAGLEGLSKMLDGKITLISGHSGVGKSTLVNALIPGLERATQDISEYSGKGQHTTTFAEMLPLPDKGSIIDTPGIKQLSFNYLTPEDIRHNFREIFQVGQDCRFNDCSHRNEPGCAVLDAVHSGEIYEGRYFNYLQLIEETESQNYWERQEG